MRTTALIVLAYIAMLVTVGLVVYLFFNKLDSEIDILEQPIGKHVVIESDTLMILDFKVLDDTYLLSNGLNVSRSLIEKLEIIK